MPIFDRPEERFYPPGHGNIFESLSASGLLDKLIEQGRDVIFVSNVDNTGSSVDVRIASVICRKDVDYVMEITEKTQQDIKVQNIFLHSAHLIYLGRDSNRV